MEKQKREDLQIKVVFAVCFWIFIMVLLPLFRISYYNFPSVDDIGYATGAEAVWQGTHSVIKVFWAQALYAFDYWHNWQGTFAAEWFTTSMMGFFKENAYYMGTYLSLGSFVLAELFLFWIVLKKVIGADFYRAGIAAFLIISVQVLMTPVPSEAFFWFCGAVLYTTTYSEGLFLLGLLILLYDSEKRYQKILLSVGIFLFTVLVSGGTYVTLIGILLFYLFITAYYWYRKNPNRWIATVGMALYLAGFFLNVLAPGNQSRLNASGAAGMPAMKAILMSLAEAFLYILRNTMSPVVILAFILLPLFMHMVKKKHYKYPFPFLITLLSFGIFAAQFTPNMYTLGFSGAGRIQNIYRWTYYLWIYGNEFYWTGWFLCGRQKDIKEMMPESRNDKTEEKQGYPFAKYLLAAEFLIAVALFYFSLYACHGDTLTSYSALQSLRNGGAQTYYNEQQERLVILKDNSIKDVYLKPFSYKPYVLFFGDITDNPDDWVNASMASYYNKNFVVLEN